MRENTVGIVNLVALLALALGPTSGCGGGASKDGGVASEDGVGTTDSDGGSDRQDGDGGSDRADGDGGSDPTDGDGGFDSADGDGGFDSADGDGGADKDKDTVIVYGQAYWRFEEASGNKVLDTGPNGLHGTLNDRPSRTTSGAVDPVPVSRLANGQALALNWQDTKTGGFFTVPDTNAALTMGNQDFTIEAWVKLDALSSTSDKHQIQVLCLKNFLSFDIKTLDYMFLVQRGNLELSPNYGKTSGFTGRELQLSFGTGEAIWGVTSNLQISDTAWHFVSVAVDVGKNVVRFGIDTSFETIPFTKNKRVINDGPLRVGSNHQIDENTEEEIDLQFLRGSIDELRISRGFIPEKQLLNAPMQDCNNNGTWDLFDIIKGKSGDCNGNSVPDECEIAAATSQDCQPDGIPDECQLAQSIDLVYDHGGGVVGIGWRADEPYMAWLNHFNVASGAGVVDAIDVRFGTVPLGTKFGVHVWTDPNGDGDPSDARMLWSDTVTLQQSEVSTRIAVPSIKVGDTGASFFLGFTSISPMTSADYPAFLDMSLVPAPNRSWAIGSNSPVDPQALKLGAVEFGPIDTILFAGNWVIRAHMISVGKDCDANQKPDACDIAAGHSTDANGNSIPDKCEDCNSNKILDPADIASGKSLDCNADGVPDDCQLLANDCNADKVPDDCQLAGHDCNGNRILDKCEIDFGRSKDLDLSGVPDECEDCNGNGILDSKDIATASSRDCNHNSVPDECQLGEPVSPIQYFYDDGVASYGHVRFSGSAAELAWMNRFTVRSGGEWIAAIEIMWGETYPGLPAKVVVWSDPDGDGHPKDARVLRVAETKTINVYSNVWNIVPIPPTYLGPAGTSFFAGVYHNNSYNASPAKFDTTSDGQAWMSFAVAPGKLDLNELAGNSTSEGLMQFRNLNFTIRAVGFDGVLTHDHNKNGIPDECD